jgi:hypothetical protein
MIACIVLVVVGGAVYALAAQSKAAEMGRIAFFAGLFWLAHLLATGHALGLHM